MTPCVHRFVKCTHEHYLLCANCGTYKSTKIEDPEKLYMGNYWSPELGRPTLREQVYNVAKHKEGGVTKNEAVVAAVDVPNVEAALEIACTPGVLLSWLSKTGGFQRVIGLETDPAWEKEIRGISGFEGELIFGFFPARTRKLPPESFSLIIALDVYEHSLEPQAFLWECHRLLVKNGQLLLMLPLVAPDLPQRFFTPEEHVYLHSKANLEAMITEGNCFDSVTFSRWCAGHDIVTARKL